MKGAMVCPKKHSEDSWNAKSWMTESKTLNPKKAKETCRSCQCQPARRAWSGIMPFDRGKLSFTKSQIVFWEETHLKLGGRNLKLEVTPVPYTGEVTEPTGSNHGFTHYQYCKAVLRHLLKTQARGKYKACSEVNCNWVIMGQVRSRKGCLTFLQGVGRDRTQGNL